MREELFKGINKMENIECYILVTDCGIMVHGNDVEIKAMLSQTVNQLKVHGFEDRDLKKAFELGLLTYEEREEIVKEKLEGLIDKLFERMVKE